VSASGRISWDRPTSESAVGRLPLDTTDTTAQSRWLECLPAFIPLPSASAQISEQPSPASTMARTPSSSRTPHGLRHHPPTVRVGAGQRPAAEGLDGRSIQPVSIPPAGISEGPQPASPQARGPFSTWWQVKDSNLRSFRDGFTVPRLQACDHWKRLTRNNFRAYSPQIADVSPSQPDTSRRLAAPPKSLIGRLRPPDHRLQPWAALRRSSLRSRSMRFQAKPYEGGRQPS